MKVNWSWALSFCALMPFMANAQTGHFGLKALSASGSHTIINDGEIHLNGGNQVLRVELQLSGWAPTGLKGWQARIDSATYSNGIGGTLTPNMIACSPGPFCVQQYESGSVCSGGICTAAWINPNRADWVHFLEEQCTSIQRGVGVGSLNYLWFAASSTDCLTFDDGTTKYGGGLALFVPPDAAGTYELAFFEVQNETFMIDADNSPFPSHTYSRLKVVVLCSTNTDCDDNNACTTDTCAGNGVCTNTPNFDPAQFCCNPANGALTPLSDSNQCTDDICNADGTVSHPNRPALTACGDPTNTECNKPDSCDGSGTCLPRFEPNTTNCGDPTNTICNPADKCNGSGACVANIAVANTPCGDPSDTECDNPDTCNGLGGCLPNTVANNTPCNDGMFCTLNERCTAGACGGGTQRDCADLLTCTTDTCDEGLGECVHSLDPNRCLIEDVCYVEGVINTANTCEACDSLADPNNWTVLEDGTECNDGNACTGTGRPGIGIDTCTGGACMGVPDPECNDQCEFAVPAVVGQNLSDNSSAGVDDAEASCEPNSNADVWFEYIADCDGAVFISTTGSSLQPINDGVLSVYDECPTLGGNEIACDDDSGVGLNAALTFLTQMGERYLIRVAGFDDNVGPIILNLLPVDDCLIDGVCYAAGDLNPENDCQACIPAISTTQWSPRPEGAACGDPSDTECDNPDACDGAGICEVNYKTDGTLCSDEANECTKNFCEAGLCIHPPEPAGLACGDPLDSECDNPDTCDGGGLCVDNFEAMGFPCGDSSESQCDNPDICDGEGMCQENLKPDGTACDDEDLCTGTDICTEGLCAGSSILQAPLVEAISGKHLRVTPQPPGSVAPIALYVTSPDYPCLSQYINLAGGLVGFDDRVIQLVDDWGTIIVQDPDIVPSTDYEVRAECGAFLSDPGTDQTHLWGDVDNSGIVDVLDISYVVNGIKGLPVPFPSEALDLFPCTPDDWINVIEIAMVVDALKGLPYPCGLPCHD